MRTRKPSQNKRVETVHLPAKVVTFGELLLRLDAPGFDRIVQTQQFAARYTGAEANAAVALAQWGVEAYVVSKVPIHEVGQACVNSLRRYGVRTDYIARGGERLGLLYVETGASQRPSKVIYDRAHSSFCGARESDFDWQAILAGKDWLHFSGTAPALGPDVLRILKDGLIKARAVGLTISFDSNYRSTLWSRDEASRTGRELMAHVDVFIGTSHDARLLFGVKGDGACSAERLRKKFGLKCVAYTIRQGESASVNSLRGLLCDARGIRTSLTYEMQMVDRIGGGDAFSAGLIFGLLHRWPTQKTVDFAAAASVLKHSIPGDFNLASFDEVLALTAGDASGRIQR